MLRKVFEWYRVAEPTPSSQVVEARTSAIKDFIAQMDDAGNYDLLVGSIALAIAGLGTLNNESPIITALVGNIRDHQSAFPLDVSENAIALQACAAIAVGEVIVRDQDANNIPETDGQITAALIVSGTSLRSRPRGKFMGAIFDELRSIAFLNLERSSAAVRRRVGLDSAGLEKVAVEPDLPAFWKKLLPLLKSNFERLESQALSDREEIEALWWLYSGYSKRLHGPLEKLDLFGSAVSCSIEIADFIKVPGPESVRQMVQRAVESGRKKSEREPKSLASLVGSCKQEGLALLGPADGNTQELVKGFPSLLPLSWLSSRLLDSSVKDGWEQEFNSKSGIAANKTITLAEMAVQSFNERVAQRIFASGHSN